MKVNSIKTIYNPISFKDNPVNEPVKTQIVQLPPSTVAADTTQFKQAVKITPETFGARFFSSLKKFSQTPINNPVEEWTPDIDRLALIRSGLY